MVINYEKYENMSQKQLLNSLTHAEKKLDDISDLIHFLTQKIKEKHKEEDFIPYKNSQSYKLGAEYEKKLNKEEKALLMQEVEQEINQSL